MWLDVLLYSLKSCFHTLRQSHSEIQFQLSLFLMAVITDPKTRDVSLAVLNYGTHYQSHLQIKGFLLKLSQQCSSSLTPVSGSLQAKWKTLHFCIFNKWTQNPLTLFIWMIFKQIGKICLWYFQVCGYKHFYKLHHVFNNKNLIFKIVSPKCTFLWKSKDFLTHC